MVCIRLLFFFQALPLPLKMGEDLNTTCVKTQLGFKSTLCAEKWQIAVCTISTDKNNIMSYNTSTFSTDKNNLMFYNTSTFSTDKNNLILIIHYNAEFERD